ncbi:hypothetical protein, partial [Enterobacter bugandensis]
MTGLSINAAHNTITLSPESTTLNEVKGLIRCLKGVNPTWVNPVSFFHKKNANMVSNEHLKKVIINVHDAILKHAPENKDANKIFHFLDKEFDKANSKDNEIKLLLSNKKIKSSYISKKTLNDCQDYLKWKCTKNTNLSQVSEVLRKQNIIIDFNQPGHISIEPTINHYKEIDILVEKNTADNVRKSIDNALSFSKKCNLGVEDTIKQIRQSISGVSDFDFNISFKTVIPDNGNSDARGVFIVKSTGGEERIYDEITPVISSAKESDTLKPRLSFGEGIGDNIKKFISNNIKYSAA